MKVLRLLPLLAALLAFTGLPLAAQSPSAPASATPQTDPSYKLIVGDQIAVSIFGESELGVSQRLDAQGRVRLALVGDLILTGKSVREAETLIEQLYIDRHILKQPMVSLTVQAYAIRDISILGAVRSPGKLTFPPEKSTLDVTDVITRAGGFLPTAKSDLVKITRVDAAGRETTIELNVEAMLTRRGANANTPKEYPILPGDRLWVPERLF
ncbi:MAG: polysaccharide biosynthesis/export family protein [Opitutaceae bacterium]|nr:polysaccharide biosynthesis/export family protein [Opitutaceae bacterium]